MTSPSVNSGHNSIAEIREGYRLGRLYRRLRHLPKPKDRQREIPLGVIRGLTANEKEGKSPINAGLPVVTLMTEIAEHGFQWRDEETRRLADRANLLLSAASVVLGLSTAFGKADFSASTRARELFIGALVVYVILAALMVLALRPRPLSRDTGYAVDWLWKDTISLHRRHQIEVCNRVKELDGMTRRKALMVVWGAFLLVVEVGLLTVALILTIQNGAG
jgi:hypothetical protein